MKKVILPLAIICCTLTSAFAQDMGRRGDNRRDQRGLGECLVKTDLLTRENQSLLDKLTNCKAEQDNNRSDRIDREKFDQIIKENNELTSRNQILLDQVEKLKIDNARLDMEAHPDRGNRFDLSKSISACSKINNVFYTQQCIALAKSNSIQSNIIDQCARISNTYYAFECLKTASAKDTNARQIESCLEINNEVYAVQCIDVAGSKKIRSDVISSCLKTTTNIYFQLECIKSM